MLQEEIYDLMKDIHEPIVLTGYSAVRFRDWFLGYVYTIEPLEYIKLSEVNNHKYSRYEKVDDLLVQIPEDTFNQFCEYGEDWDVVLHAMEGYEKNNSLNEIKILDENKEQWKEYLYIYEHEFNKF